MRRDPARLAALRELLILESTPEQAYDDLTRALASAFGVPITIVNLLDEDRDWFKSCVGLMHFESPASTSFCEVFFRTDRNLIVVEDTTLDPLFSDHPLVIGAPFIRFYAAARLTSEGQTVGTLCAYDTQPRAIGDLQRDQLEALAAAAMALFDQRSRG